MEMDTDTDWDAWPLLEIDVADVALADTATAVAGTLQAALDKGEPFAALIGMGERDYEAAGRTRGPGALERVRTLKRLRGGLTERCRGLAFVLPAEGQAANTKALRAGSKLWGCPVKVTSSTTEGRAWIRAQLTGET